MSADSKLSPEEKVIALRDFPNLTAQEDDNYNLYLGWNIRMQKFLQKINEMKNANVVMACGATGVGKSTLMNAII